jgi:hypothetical protein
MFLPGNFLSARKTQIMKINASAVKEENVQDRLGPGKKINSV